MNDTTPGRTSHLSSLLYFVVGGLVGAGVALLLAPQSGSATRDMMRRKLADTTDSARDLKDRLTRGGQRIRNEATHRVEGAVSALAGSDRPKLPV